MVGRRIETGGHTKELEFPNGEISVDLGAAQKSLRLMCDWGSVNPLSSEDCGPPRPITHSSPSV